MPNSRRAGWLLTAGAALFAFYVLLHPRGAVEEAETLDEAVHSMAIESAWVISHVVGFVAVVAIGLGVLLLLRSGWLNDQQRARRAAWLLVAGAAGAAIELVPHILVSSETTELAAGRSAPITGLHLFLQATLLPIYGAGVAALAVTGFRVVAHPVACVLGAIGGAALVAVGPLLYLTGDPAFGVVFMPAGGTFLFLLAAGARVVRAGERQPALVG